MISVGQRLTTSAVAVLQSALDQVNGMNEEERNTSFRRALLSQDPRDKELRGLLDLAIHSKHRIKSSIDSEGTDPFVSIQVVV